MASTKITPLYTETPYRAFSGCDIQAFINHHKAASLQSITVSITREVAPLYTMGDPAPRAFVKGKRGIAGTLVFTQFDRHALLEGIYGQELVDIMTNVKSFLPTRFSGASSPWLELNTNPGSRDIIQSPDLEEAVQTEINELYSVLNKRLLQYVDQLPPFDVTITMVDEAGNGAFCSIRGIVLINEGWGYTIDDLSSENAFTFVARAIEPLKSLTSVANPAKKGFGQAYSRRRFFY